MFKNIEVTLKIVTVLYLETIKTRCMMCISLSAVNTLAILQAKNMVAMSSVMV